MDGREPSPERGDLHLVRVDGLARSGPQGVFEDGIHLGRQDQRTRLLLGTRAGEVDADDPVGLSSAGRLLRPIEGDAVPPGQPAAVDRLGAAKQRDIELASQKGTTRLIDQQLWAVSPDGGHDGLARARATR